MEEPGQEFTHQIRGFGLSVVTAIIVVPLLFIVDGHLAKRQTQQPQIENQEVLAVTARVAVANPVRLMIPAIDVNANIQHVGINMKGEMDVPSNVVDVAWFEQGFKPGERGNAVIAGHFNSETGGTAVFTDLSKLKKGNKIYVEDENGNSTIYVVRESRHYDAGYADDIFSKSDDAHLNLITCFGTWNEETSSFSKRLVVFADILH